MDNPNAYNAFLLYCYVPRSVVKQHDQPTVSYHWLLIFPSVCGNTKWLTFCIIQLATYCHVAQLSL